MEEHRSRSATPKVLRRTHPPWEVAKNGATVSRQRNRQVREVDLWNIHGLIILYLSIARMVDEGLNPWSPKASGQGNSVQVPADDAARVGVLGRSSS